MEFLGIYGLILYLGNSNHQACQSQKSLAVTEAHPSVAVAWVLVQLVESHTIFKWPHTSSWHNHVVGGGKGGRAGKDEVESVAIGNPIPKPNMLQRVAPAQYEVSHTLVKTFLTGFSTNSHCAL